MQRKAYRTGLWGAAALSALSMTLLSACSADPGDPGQAADSKPGTTGSATPVARPGKYRTLPDPCGAVDHGTLDKLLPGIKEITDDRQREDAYAGEANLTYDTDRRVGCRWSVASVLGSDQLSIDLERVVSYDSTVSDDGKAQELFTTKQEAAHLPAAGGSGDSDSGGSGSGTSKTPKTSGTPKATKTDKTSKTARAAGSASGSSRAGSTSREAPGTAASTKPSGSPDPSDPSGSASPGATGSPTGSPTVDPSEIQPRTLDDLGDEAFLDDVLGAAGSAAGQRTVTVAFRTSNVIVTIQYATQSAVTGEIPDSKELQDKAREVADKLAGQLSD